MIIDLYVLLLVSILGSLLVESIPMFRRGRYVHPTISCMILSLIMFLVYLGLKEVTKC